MSGPQPAWADEAIAAGWLPPGDAEFMAWRAINLRRGTCRWCGAVRTRSSGRAPGPHRLPCRFYDGPVKHAFANGHYGTFDFWIRCTCGRSYPQHDIYGTEQECPDREMAWRCPRELDLAEERLLAEQPGENTPPVSEASP